MTKPDVTLTVFSNKEKGLYGYECTGMLWVPRYACGRLYGATTQTLLTYAICSGLKALTDRAAAKCLFRKGDEPSIDDALSHGRRLRVLIQTINLPLYKELIDAEKISYRAAAHVKDEMKKEVKRFEVSWRLCGRDEAGNAYRWADRMLPKPHYSDGFPRPELVCSE